MNQGPEDALTLRSSGDEQTVGSKESTRERLASSTTDMHIRSSSPSKRRASAMDDGAHKGGDKMQVDNSETSGETDDTHIATTPSTSKSTSDQNTRETSVDMLGSDTLSGAASTNPTSMTDTPQGHGLEDAKAPTIDEQVNIILREAQVALEDGMVGFAVSSAWISRVLARSSVKDDHEPYEKSVLEGDVGPVDNNSILLQNAEVDVELLDEYGERFVSLKPGLRLGEELQVLPEKAANLVTKWYGMANGQMPIKRYAHATNPDGEDRNIQWELYPPIFTLRKLHSVDRAAFDKTTTEDAKRKAPRLVASRNGTYHAFLRRAKEAAGVPLETKVKVWRVLDAQSTTEVSQKLENSTSLLSPPQSREATPAGQVAQSCLLIKNDAFKAMSEGVEREAVDYRDTTVDSKYNGRVQLALLGLATDQILILEEQGNNGFLSEATRKGGKNGLKKGGLLSNNSSGRSSPSIGPTTRGRNRANGRTQGSVGLTNLGNTCYMNSALQCIRAAEELTSFFLSHHWSKQLNPKNPLGYGGKVAATYAQLLETIYKTNSSSTTPSEFKKVLGKCGPQFSGYGQQDSQEFMSFLVDALHEDLNRIEKKPYIENPDSNDARIDDPEYVKELGEIFRNNYRARNDSVVVDLFNGFYKNTMVCPSCDKISVTFDPYLLLTLQLPLEHSWQHPVHFIPLCGEAVKIDIDMDKHGTIRQLKEYVASKFPGMDAKRLMMAEIFSKKFYRTVEDKQTIAEANIQARDDMILYELDEVPSNFPPQKRKKRVVRSMYGNDDEEEDIPGSESSLADRMMVPVYHRAKINQYGSKSLVLTPFFITLNRQEVCNYQEIVRKILARAATLTTRDFLGELTSTAATASSEVETDAVITTEEDASSNTEPDVQARSVEGEDGIVEISMGNTDTDAANQEDSGFAVLQSGRSIPKSLFELFELKYMPKGTEMVPTGYSNVDPMKNYRSLTTRLPQIRKSPSVSSDNGQTPPASGESSDADELAPIASVQPSFTNGTGNGTESESDGFIKRNTKKLKTYTTKGRTQDKFGNDIEDPEDSLFDHQFETEEPIVNLGECIVVDWTTEAYDALFEGRNANNLRGEEITIKDMPLLEDVELAEKKRKRSERKKHGISLDDCFQVTARGEILTEENQWYCNSCKEMRQAEKTLAIWTAPDILVIHLKRFSAQRQFRDKIDILVDFPVEGLNLNDKVGLKEDKDLTYDLFAVDNHYGGLGGGHYTAFAKNFIDEQWYEYNDSSVSKRSAPSVVTSAAYLLFYRRRSEDHFLGPPSIQKLVADFRHGEETEDVSDSEAPSSRAGSPSGKGPRLGGKSFLNGSSSNSVAAGAGRPHRRGGDGLGLHQEEPQRSGLVDGYDAEVEDEGLILGDDDDVDAPILGPQLPPAYAQQSWNFEGILAQHTEDLAGAGADDDINSMAGGASNDAVPDLHDRLMEDFGSDHGEGFESVRRNSPEIWQSTEHNPLADLDHLEGIDDALPPDYEMHDSHQGFEDTVAEIHLEESPPPRSSLGSGAGKDHGKDE